MILEACIDWDDPSLPMIGIHGERLPSRRPSKLSYVMGGDEYEPSPELDLFLSYLDDTDERARRCYEKEGSDYRVTLYRVRGDYCRALRIETHCSDRTWFYQRERDAVAAWELAIKP